MRLFVALELPDAWRAAALEARAALEATLHPADARSLRWVQPDLLHLTLRFLGEFPDGELARLQSALDEHVEAFDLDLGIGALGAFGGRNGAQVVWLGVAGNLEGLRALTAQVDRACIAAGAAADARSFQPHITLARVRERTPAGTRRAIASAVGALPPPPSEGFRARAAALVRSRLGAGAPRYEVLSRHPPTAVG